jgi:drug/metabolite transporter (DMT)-like permease
MSGHTPSPLWPGVPMALASAFLFGATAPLAKGMLGSIEPQLLAGLLYLGAGVGLAAVHAARNAIGIPAPEAPLRSTDFPWLAAVIVFGGILGPVLLMLGLNRTDAASGSLLLNLEGLATMIIAWVVFRENVDRRLLLGALAIIIGAIVLSWNGTGISIDAGALLIAGACVAWAIDNNLTRKLSSADPVVIAMTKGLIAGIANIGVAIERGVVVPAAADVGAAALLGFFAIGASLVLFILALRHLGTARTGAYFSIAPFLGAIIAVVFLGDPISAKLSIAAALMSLGLWMHLTENHVHSHDHEFLEHEHSHVHDDHHRHDHNGLVSEPHSHRHIHEPMQHRHAHFPDLHHRHGHAD